jgi:hypothetical protein
MQRWARHHLLQIPGNNLALHRLLAKMVTVGTFFGPISLRALSEATRQIRLYARAIDIHICIP